MPIEVTGARRGDVFVPQTKADAIRLRELPENRHVKAKFNKPRKPAHHRTFFGYIAMAYDNWPDVASKFEPENEEHLRAWLLCHTTHRECGDFDIDDVDARDPKLLAIEIAAFLSAFAGGKYFFVRRTDKGIRAYKAKSIAHDESDQQEFSPVADHVFGIIKDFTGISVEEYIEMHGKKNEREHAA